MGKITLITGGARSGKSRFAVKLASQSKNKVIYVATAQAGDREMEERIAKHKKTRPAGWVTVEEPKDLRKAISKYKSGVLLVDCITIYVSNLFLEMHEKDAEEIETRIRKNTNAMVEELRRRKGDSILVTNELGMGIVPENPMARKFRDVAGNINQLLAESADGVYLAVCGIPVRIK